MLSYYVYSVEIIGPDWRLFSGRLFGFAWPIAASIMAGMAYLIRDWRHLLLSISFFVAPVFLFWKVLPESPRWLVINGRLDEAYSNIKKYGLRKSKPNAAEELKATIEAFRVEQLANKAKNEAAPRRTPLDIFRTPKLRKRSLLVCFNWFVSGLSGFGFFFYLSSLHGDLYINYIYMACVKLPADVLCLFAMKKIGRRLTTSFTHLFAGTLCLLVMAIPADYPIIVTVLALGGQAFVYTGFINIYLFTSELYPTELRNIALGVGSMSARIGAIIAPYVALLAQLPSVDETLPIIIFGASAMASGLLSLWLPETLFVKLAQTIDETEAADEDYGIPCCGRARRQPGMQMEVIVNPDAANETKL